MKEPIETLLFDFGGTLDAKGVAWKERFYAHYRAEGLDMTADAFESCFFAADDALVGKLSPATDLAGTAGALATNLETELAHRGASHGRSDRGARVASRFMSEASATFARNRPVLRELRKRYRLGVVSNFYGNLEAVCQDAGLAPLFAVLVDSHCAGVKKPDPAIFRAALAPLEAIPETSVFVGDSLRRDGAGARQAGMRFIWMAPEGVAAAEALAAADPPLEHAVTELGDLMKILP